MLVRDTFERTNMVVCVVSSATSCCLRLSSEVPKDSPQPRPAAIGTNVSERRPPPSLFLAHTASYSPLLHARDEGAQRSSSRYL
jgi:hypothetical protein